MDMVHRLLLHRASAEGVIVLALCVCLSLCVCVRLTGKTKEHTDLNFGNEGQVEGYLGQVHRTRS